MTVLFQGAIFTDELCLVREGWVCKGKGSFQYLSLLGEGFTH